MKFLPLFLLLILISCQEQKKLTPEPADEAFLKKLEINQKEQFKTFDIQNIIRNVEDIIQDYCTANKTPPQLEVINHLAREVKFGLIPELENQVAEVTVSELDLKYSAENFECRGPVRITIGKLPYTKRFTLPFPHESETPAEFWKEN